MTGPDVGADSFASSAVWSTTARRAGQSLLVLLHGRGGTEDDLTSIFTMLPASTVAVTLRGGVAHRDRWAWFDTDREPPFALDEAVDAVVAWLDRAWPAEPAGPVGVVGFSQGGALALELLRRTPERFAYAGQICGFHLTNGPTDDLDRRRPPVFSAYGGKDDVISPRQAKRTTAWLRRHTDVSEHYYAGLRHEIADHVLRDAADFVARHQ